MHVNRGLLLGLMASVAAVTVASTPAVTQQTQKPNVVFILADNVGYGDLGPYGGANCAAHRRQISTASPVRACVSRSIWSNPPAHLRARR